MTSVATTAGLLGITAYPLIITAHRSNRPGITLLGPSDAAMRDTVGRISDALGASGVQLPVQGLSAARSTLTAPMHSDAHDLAYAVALARANTSEPIPAGFLARLESDGSLRPVRGIYALMAGLAATGVSAIYVAPANKAEADLVDGINAIALPTLAHVLAHLEGRTTEQTLVAPQAPPTPQATHPDLGAIVGNRRAIDTAVIAVTGGHDLQLTGDVRAADTIVEATAALLPRLTAEDSHTATLLASIRGTLHNARVTTAPYVRVNPTTTMSALVGGGLGIAKPGAISAAHAGMLHLSDALELPDVVWHVLRQPRVTGQITLHRSQGAVTYPARFQLAITTRLCPCGHSRCDCSTTQRRRYTTRESRRAPHITLQAPVEYEPEPTTYAPTSEVAQRVATARATAAERYAAHGWHHNHQATRRWLYANTPRAIVDTTNLMVSRGRLTTEGADEVLRAAWTAADLEGAGVPTLTHVEQVA